MAARSNVVWLSGLRGLPDEVGGATLPRLWAQGERRLLPARDELEIMGRLLGLAEPLPAAALLAAAEGIACDEAWVLALEPMRIGGGAGRALLQPGEILPKDEQDALFAAAQEFVEELPWRLAQGRERWYILSSEPLQLGGPPFSQMLERELRQQDLGGPHGGRWRRTLDALQMVLAAHPVNRRRELRGCEPWTYFWPWGEGRLPVSSRAPVLRGIFSPRPELQAAARYFGIELASEPQPGSAGPWLWEYPHPWQYGETAADFEQRVAELLRRRDSLSLYTGLLPRGGVERCLWHPRRRWAFWRQRRWPDGAARPGAWT
ncbi:hypothetical protein [Acidithiobacillus sp.]|uniref:hypothetical protein n=1 Tax=Acidithiobacillus sp. TaxID=1872118 RepID=UPI0025C0F681|nr:hypothetical protein [Acidithiobacillus sp.]